MKPKSPTEIKGKGISEYANWKNKKGKNNTNKSTNFT